MRESGTVTSIQHPRILETSIQNPESRIKHQASSIQHPAKTPAFMHQRPPLDNPPTPAIIPAFNFGGDPIPSKIEWSGR